MSINEIAENIASLTEGWDAEAIPNADLAEAQLALAATLRAGLAPTRASINFGAVNVTSQNFSSKLKKPLPTQSIHETVRKEQQAVTSQELGYVSHSAGDAPEWAQDMQVGRTHGPFTDRFGQVQWVNTVPLIEQQQVAFNVGTNVQMTLPLATGQAPAQTVKLQAGTLWIASKCLCSAIPHKGFTGLRITGGTLAFSQPLTLSGNTWVVPLTGQGTVTCDLEQPSAPLAGEIGLDARRANSTMPTKIVLTMVNGAAGFGTIASGVLNAFGSSVALEWQGASPIYVDSQFSLQVPLKPVEGKFEFADSAAKMFVASGSAPIFQAAWVLPIAQTSVAHLGSAAGVGQLALRLDGGVTGHWYTHDAITALDELWLYTSPGFVSVNWKTTRKASSKLLLWKKGSSRFRSFIEVLYGKKPAAVVYTATPDMESLATLVSAQVFADRPVQANGKRLSTPMIDTAVVRNKVSSLDSLKLLGAVSLLGTGSPAASSKPASIALENMLLSVGSLEGFIAGATLIDDEIASATLALSLPARWALPTLPDPYAANFDLATAKLDQQKSVDIVALTSWTGGDAAPQLSFLRSEDVTSAELAVPAPQLTASPSPGLFHVGTLKEEESRKLHAVGSSQALKAITAAQKLAGLATAVEAEPDQDAAALPFLVAPGGAVILLDLSSRAGQFGVGIFNGKLGARANVAGPSTSTLSASTPAAGFEGLSAVVNERDIFTFALPQTSWEAVNSVASPAEVIAADPAWDGMPLMVRAYDEQRLVPVEPMAVMERQRQHVNSERGALEAIFSLPLGLEAYVHEPRTDGKNFVGRGGAFQWIQPAFAVENVTGLPQLRLKSPGSTGFQGSSWVEKNISATDGSGVPYAEEMLGKVQGGSQGIGDIYDSEFFSGDLARVPLTGIDLSGYGASLTSSWDDTATSGPHISKVHFDAYVGRTAHEVIQAVSTLYPYCARVVRTITMQRGTSGWINRKDSGWLAQTSGRFRLPGVDDAGNQLQAGAVSGVYNITNLRETGDPVLNLGGGFTFTQVLFDANVGLVGNVKVTAGGHKATDDEGNAITLLPSHDLVGYVQLTPAGTALEAGQLPVFFQKAGPFQPTIAGTAELGATTKGVGTGLRCTGIRVGVITESADASPVPALGVSLMAAPHLPGDGSWTLGVRPYTSAAPLPLPPATSLPVVQKKGNTSHWHFAALEDVLRLDESDTTSYSFTQATGSQKLLFERPRIANFDPASAAAPLMELPPGAASQMADMAALLGSSGLFPDLSKAKGLVDGAIHQLFTLPEGLKYQKTATFDEDTPDLPLIPATVLQVALQYRGEKADGTTSSTEIKVLIDPLVGPGAARWEIEANYLTFAVTVPVLSDDPILSVLGNFRASELEKPHVASLQVKMGPLLSILQSIFSRLQFLAQFLPGGKAAGLKVALSGTKLAVSESFSIPQLPLGLGEIDDVTLNMGVNVQLSPPNADMLVSIGTELEPFHWIVSPLAGTGFIALGVQDGNYKIEFQAGIGLGLAIDVGIASGSASVTVAFDLTVQPEKLTVIILLTGQASVDVLDGLASASLTLTAGMGLSADPVPPSFQLLPTGAPLHAVPTGVHFDSETITMLATVSVGIHLSICWVVSVDWDGSWQFQQSVHTPEITVNI